jgi:hypothetical protein
MAREKFGHAADVRVDSEDFLDHHHAAARLACGQRLPGADASVRSLDLDAFAHFRFL